MLLGIFRPAPFVICRIGSLEMLRATCATISTVICRIGSLEILSVFRSSLLLVICRIGSLENWPDGVWWSGCVICRIGSLEKINSLASSILAVICRIGSLENRWRIVAFNSSVICRIGSLEIEMRQGSGGANVICRIGSLETTAATVPAIDASYLPYRQLRKYQKMLCRFPLRYLPYRQVIYFIVLFLWLTSDGGRLFVLCGWCCRAYVAKWGAFLSGAVFPVL